MTDTASKRDARLKGRCDVLADVVKEVGSIYRRTATAQDQKSFMETTVGAALWYLPATEECWTGKISIKAVRSCHPDNGDNAPKLTKDHEYPRKIAATDLLTQEMSEEKDSGSRILSLYLSKYGRFNYVTPQENKALARFQKKGEFEDPATAYEKAGIRLLTITGAELRKIKARDLKTVEGLLKSV